VFVNVITHLGGGYYNGYFLRYDQGKCLTVGIREWVDHRNFLGLGRTDIHVIGRIVSK
jgi:hypothetical protein